MSQLKVLQIKFVPLKRIAFIYYKNHTTMITLNLCKVFSNQNWISSCRFYVQFRLKQRFLIVNKYQKFVYFRVRKFS